MDIVKFLVEHGANVNTQLKPDDLRDECPLSIAISQSSNDIIKFLVEHGADVNVKLTGEREDCPLSFAIKQNSMDIVKFLVEHGADVNAKLTGLRDECPLSIAISQNSMDIVKFLVEHGANVNTQLKVVRSVVRALWDLRRLDDLRTLTDTDRCECPLSIAIEQNSNDIVKFLIDHGATTEVIYKI